MTVRPALKPVGGIQLLSKDRQVLTAQALLVIAILFGGGGSNAGIFNLIVQLAALAALAFNRRAAFEFITQAPRPLVVLIALTLAIPLLQTIPLPPSIWQKLPGRELVVESLSLIGEENRWMPFSVQSQRTFIAFLSLIPPLTILILTWNKEREAHLILLRTLVVCGVLVICLGAQQLALGNQKLVFFDEAFGTQDLQGTFANRNTVGVFAVTCLCALVGLLWSERHRPMNLWIGAMFGAILLIGVFLSRSRSSMALTLIPAAMFGFYIWQNYMRRLSMRTRLITIIGALVVIGGTGFLLSQNARIQNSLSRFENLQDARPQIWEDTQGSIKRFWPLGSGMGTFDEVFQLDETLENLNPGRAARAHNEYLETMVEIGALGPVMILAWLAVVLWLMWRGRAPRSHHGLLIGATAFFMVMAFQSVTDYPLRSQTMLGLAAVMLALLARRQTDSRAGAATSPI